MNDSDIRLAKGIRFLAGINPKKYKIETEVFNDLVLYERIPTFYRPDLQNIEYIQLPLVYVWREEARTGPRYSQDFKSYNQKLLEKKE